MTKSLLRQPLTTILTVTVITANILETCKPVTAVGPNAIDQQAIQQGKELFEREWPSRNPRLGNDGLGPLHNAKSCVACHHQGGVGGSGDARFNANTIGIEKLQVTGLRPSQDVVASMLETLHPGFTDSHGVMKNTLPLHHHGTSAFLKTNQAIMSGIPALFSKSGGPVSAEEVRIANATPIVYSSQKGVYNLTVNARLFQRNTPALFGSGIIDQVSKKALDAVVKAQKTHPEISGRPSTLKDGRYGRFGWRANVASLIDFNDQACAAELGLETKRREQPADPFYPNYKNPSIDITDHQIRTLTSFVKALPAPIRGVSNDSVKREEEVRGEKLFSSIGCSICHQPNLENAKGIYSDLLLHDMGYESTDINFAEPYRIRFTPIVNTKLTTSTTMPSYYGGSQTILTTTGSLSSDSKRESRVPSSRNFVFNAAKQPQKMQFVTLGRSSKVTFSEETVDKTTGQSTRSKGVQEKEYQMKIQIEPTNHMQEWRTPPLWGVRDSAPYMHDGRAGTLLEAVSMHEGEAAGTRDRFLNLSHRDRSAIITFMETLVAPTNVPIATR